MNLPLPKSDTTPVKKDGKLDEDEYKFILDDTLKADRRNDPTILAFIDSFVKCKNILQASEEAGIHRTVGYRIRHYVDVSAAITKLTDRSAVKYGFDASEIMERTKEMVDFDPILVQNPDGTFKSNLYEIPAEARRNIKKLKVKNLYADTEDINGIKRKIIVGEVIEYEFYDKLKAIDLVGKEKSMFKTTTKVEHDVSKDMATLLLASAKRGEEATKKLENADVVEVVNVKGESDEDN